jgi:hypothetical protein
MGVSSSQTCHSHRSGFRATTLTSRRRGRDLSAIPQICAAHRPFSSRQSRHNQTDPRLCGAFARLSAAGQTFVQGIRLLGRQTVRDLVMGSSEVCATPSAAPPQPRPGKAPGRARSQSAPWSTAQSHEGRVTGARASAPSRPPDETKPPSRQQRALGLDVGGVDRCACAAWDKEEYDAKSPER